MQNVATDKTAFDRPYDPVSSQGMMRHAIDTESKLNDILNGEQAFDRMLFSASTELAITGGVLAATSLAVHTVAAQTSTTDDLDTIPAVNNTFLFLKAKSGHIIVLRHGTGNIATSSGIDVYLLGNRMVLLYCQGGQWSTVGNNVPLDNLSVTRDPTSADDALSGYAVGSRWVNTTLDRTWVCVDASSGAAIWKAIHNWKNSFIVRAANTNVVGIGCPGSIGGTPSNANANDNDNTWTQTSTSSAANISSGTPARYVRPAHNPIFEGLIKTGSDLTSLFLWIGLFAALPPAANTLTDLGIGFRYSASAGDAGFVPVLFDGVTQNTGTAIGTISTDTVYELRFRVDDANSRVYFSVNNSTEQMLSTNYPGAAAELVFFLYIATSGGVSRSVIHSKFEATW